MTRSYVDTDSAAHIGATTVSYHAIDNNSFTHPANASYFFGRITRDNAENILKQAGCQNGLFLLREQMQECGAYALSVCLEGIVHHFRIIRLDDGLVQLDNNPNGPKFNGPIELIRHYQAIGNGLLVQPTIECQIDQWTQPYYFTFITTAKFYQLVDNEIKQHLQGLRKTLIIKTEEEYRRQLREASGRYRYKYERIILKKFHLSQSWFKNKIDKKTLEKSLANQTNGKFVVNSVPTSGKKEEVNENYTGHYELALVFNKSLESEFGLLDLLIRIHVGPTAQISLIQNLTN